jgi:hypothetical protein
LSISPLTTLPTAGIFGMHDALMDVTYKKTHRIMWKFPQHLNNKIISSATTSISLKTAIPNCYLEDVELDKDITPQAL